MSEIDNEEVREYHLLPEEREYCFGGSVADEYFTLDITKCKSFNRNAEIWRKAAEKNPKDFHIQFEDKDHIIIKAKRTCVQFPKPKTKKELSDEQRQAIAERMKNSRK